MTQDQKDRIAVLMNNLLGLQGAVSSCSTRSDRRTIIDEIVRIRLSLELMLRED